MASSLQSRGFDVNVMPGFQLANPSVFNALGPVSQGLSSGLGMGAQLQDIMLRRDAANAEAQFRPLRKQLMQAEVARAMQQQRLADIQFPGQVAIAEKPIETPIGTFQDLDEEGNLVEYGNFEYVDPKTGEKGQYTGRALRTLKTAAQLEQDRLNAEAMRSYRTGMGEAAQTRAVTAQQLADWKIQNPTVKTKTFYDKDLNVFEQVVNPDGSLGVAVQVMLPNGQPAKKPQSQMDGLAAALGALSGANPSMPVAPAPVQTGAISNLDALGNLANQFASQPKTFASEAEAAAAAQSGLIKPGDKIVIAGVQGTWR